MFFHVILTTECNSQCTYCYGEALEDADGEIPEIDVDYSLPSKINYDLEILERFCGQDPNCILTFYGGEPLLCTDQIEQIMDRTAAKLFIMQTNGLLLDRLKARYLNRFHTILVSIDGERSLTDFYRGDGTFKKVINNLKLAKKNGFQGELIARMTVMESTDIYDQVRWLLRNDEFSFSSVHWQLNAGFWKADYARRGFEKWSTEDYNIGVRKLAEFWVDKMENEGVVLRLYPFLGIAESLLSGEKKTLLRCGGGWINYAIQTDGQIIPCPTMWGMKAHYVGHVTTANPLKLIKEFVKEPCIDCGELKFCGGRCLYANVMKRWSAEAYDQVCNTVRNLIDVVVNQMPRIDNLMNTGRISFRDFEYVRFNGCEIIP
jgi:putative peptide-modifying radical SAM enzyme